MAEMKVAFEVLGGGGGRGEQPKGLVHDRVQVWHLLQVEDRRTPGRGVGIGFALGKGPLDLLEAD